MLPLFWCKQGSYRFNSKNFQTFSTAPQPKFPKQYTSKNKLDFKDDKNSRYKQLHNNCTWSIKNVTYHKIETVDLFKVGTGRQLPKKFKTFP